VANKKIPTPQRVGTADEMIEFAALLTELSELDPESLAEFGQRLGGLQKRSRTTNKRS
jgi:hypothetical protein